jgi:hypothetical protein
MYPASIEPPACSFDLYIRCIYIVKNNRYPTPIY